MKKIEKIEPTQIVLYRAGDQDVAVEVYLKDETFGSHKRQWQSFLTAALITYRYI